MMSYSNELNYDTEIIQDLAATRSWSVINHTDSVLGIPGLSLSMKLGKQELSSWKLSDIVVQGATPHF